MKRHEEMIRDVHHRIDEYESEKKMKRAKMTKIAASVTPVCAAAVVGVGLWKGDVLEPDHNRLISSTVDSAVSNSDIVIAERNDAPDENRQNNAKAETATSTAKTTDSTGQTEKNDAMDEEVNDSQILIIEVDEAGNASNDAISPSSANNATIADENSPSVYVPTESAEPPADGNGTNGGGNGWCIFMSTLEWNGITYYDNDAANFSAYTQGNCIGKVSDFKGEYKDSVNYRINSNDSVYTVKETTDVLFVVKENGTIVIMSSPAWSLEKYESQRIEPDCIDPDATASDFNDIPMFNGFCQ